jgi:hypothetical protein
MVIVQLLEMLQNVDNESKYILEKEQKERANDDERYFYINLLRVYEE